MSQPLEAYIDVVELCGILQCLGFHVKSIDTTNTDKNASHDGPRTVIVDCQTSGLHVVLENGNFTCSCPTVASQQNSGIWQVSGVTGGKQLDKEFGSSILGSLPKGHRERLTNQLQDIVRCIKEHNEVESDKKEGVNRSASMIEMKTPDNRHLQLKEETPTRYRSLDTLTATATAEPLPTPGALLKTDHADNTDRVQAMCARQSTYTLSSTPDSSRHRNKTSSPIRKLPSSVLESLIDAEKTAQQLRSNLGNVIKDLMDDGRYDSSSSLALDVSKISILKITDNSRFQFASSPNLSGLGNAEDLTKRLNGVGSASTSNLTTKPSAKENKTSKLKKISPSFFRHHSLKTDKDKQNSNKNKSSSLFKSKIVVPIRAGTPTTDGSPNLSGSKKKFSHIKSTIPRPASAKKE